MARSKRPEFPCNRAERRKIRKLSEQGATGCSRVH